MDPTVAEIIKIERMIYRIFKSGVWVPVNIDTKRNGLTVIHPDNS